MQQLATTGMCISVLFGSFLSTNSYAWFKQVDESDLRSEIQVHIQWPFLIGRRKSDVTRSMMSMSIHWMQHVIECEASRREVLTSVCPPAQLVEKEIMARVAVHKKMPELYIQRLAKMELSEAVRSSRLESCRERRASCTMWQWGYPRCRDRQNLSH